eukprot:11154891-Lingulodinium_polyedra.AAC.1
MSTGKRKCTAVGKKRAGKAAATLRRVRSSLMPVKQRCVVAAGKAQLQAQYGNYLVGLPRKALRQLARETRA